MSILRSALFCAATRAARRQQTKRVRRCANRDYERTDDNAEWTRDSADNQHFHIDFCTVAHRNENGEIVEENLFYDVMGMCKQIGVMPGEAQKTA